MTRRKPATAKERRIARGKPFLRIKRVARRFDLGLKAIAQTFGVITALMFLMSALTGYLAMRLTLGLDYFSVATTNDVIMLGVKSFGLAVLIVVAAFSISNSIQWFERRRRLAEIRKHRSLKASPARRYLLALKRDRDDAYALMMPSLLISAVAVLIMAGLLNAEPQRVVYVSGADLPMECDYAPTLWMGSQSAVVKCTDGVRLIRDSENVVYFRPKRHCAVFPYGCQFVGLNALRAEYRKRNRP